MSPENKIRAVFITNFLLGSPSHDCQPGISFLILKCKLVLNVLVDLVLTVPPVNTSLFLEQLWPLIASVLNTCLPRPVSHFPSNRPAVLIHTDSICRFFFFLKSYYQYARVTSAVQCSTAAGHFFAAALKHISHLEANCRIAWLCVTLVTRWTIWHSALSASGDFYFFYFFTPVICKAFCGKDTDPQTAPCSLIFFSSLSHTRRSSSS